MPKLKILLEALDSLWGIALENPCPHPLYNTHPPTHRFLSPIAAFASHEYGECSLEAATGPRASVLERQ